MSEDFSFENVMIFLKEEIEDCKDKVRESIVNLDVNGKDYHVAFWDFKNLCDNIIKRLNILVNEKRIPNEDDFVDF